MTTSGTTARYAPGHVDGNGDYVFTWQLTSSRITDPVTLVLPPADVLPLVLVPGIMGSNLCDNGGRSVWRLDNPPSPLDLLLKDKPVGLLVNLARKDAGERQTALAPDTVKVDPRGATPRRAGGSVHDPKQYAERGWGEVGEGSYHGFLLWLEQALNGQGYNPALWSQFRQDTAETPAQPGQNTPFLQTGIPMSIPGLPEPETGPADLSSDELIARARYRMPVHAFGYNWLDSNDVAAQLLKDRIVSIIAQYNHSNSRCSQVVLVTHSMGGLVARCCQQLDGMQDAIAGIVHGVMPAVGAPVAYRRCKIGMKDEDAIAGMVVGSTGKEVTAVFAQAPGALQLLPTAQYRERRAWLTIDSPSGNSVHTEPGSSGNPYQDIYLCDDRWWGLIRKEWLNPPGGTGLTWGVYAKNIGKAADFHIDIKNAYHPSTYVFYGKDPHIPSFEGVHWKLRSGAISSDRKPRAAPEEVAEMGFEAVRDDGSNPLRVGGQREPMPGAGEGAPVMLETSYWDLVCAKQDGGGDGTVPASSGAFPRFSGGEAIRRQFGLHEIEHEPAYHNETARLVTLYALQKIAAIAKTGA